MDLQTATTTLRNKVGAESDLGATLKFDCGDDGVVVIDGAARPSTVDNSDRDTDCTIALTVDTLAEMMSGELSPTTAFMTGRIKVNGDMGVALKLQSVF
ncbi:MAG: SCP2 sterol-binding domain-containing protein [Burkholderiales bacterium]